MADVQIIGRVGIKVTPETKGFYRKARRDLSEIEKTLPEVEVTAEFSEKGLRQQILTSIREINREIKGNKLYKVKFDATITTDRMKSTVKTAAREMTAIAKTPGNKVKFTADLDAALPVDVELNQASQRRVEAEIKAWAETVSASVSVRTKLNPGAKELTRAELALLGRDRRVTFKPVVDKNALKTAATVLSALSGARLVTDFMSRLFEKIKNKDRAIPVIAAMSEALLGLAAASLSASANLFSISRGLAQIGPAALALPGILAGFAVGLGATVAVLKDFNKVFPGFSKRLSALQDQMSQNFYAEAERPIRRFINTLFPQFAAGIKKTSTQLGFFFAGLANGLRKNLGGGILTTMFDNLNESIKVATKSTGDMSSIIAILGTVGTEYLIRLAGWFVNITDQFEAFLSKADADGRLRGWIDTGITRLKELGSVLASLSSIFTSIAIAAEKAGGTTLTSMAESLRGIAETAKGEAFQGGLIRTLEGSNKALSNIAAISGGSFKAFMEDLSFFLNKAFPKAGETIGTVADALFSALSRPAVAAGFLSMLDGIQKGVEGLTPAFGPVADAIGAIAGKVGFLAASFGPVFGQALIIMANGIEKLIPAFEPLIGLLSGTLLETIKSVAGPFDNLFTTIADTMLNYVMPALTPVIEAFGELAQNALPLIIDGVASVVEASGPLIEKLGELFQLVSPVLIPALKFLAEILIGAVVGAVTGIIQAVGGFIDVLIGLIEFFKAAFTGDWSAAWQAIKDIGQGFLDLIVGAFKFFINFGLLKVASLGFAALKGLFKLGWKGLVSLWKNKGKIIKGLFKLLWKGLKALGKLGWKALVALGKTLWKRLTGLFSGGGKSLNNKTSNMWKRIKILFNKGKKKAIALVKKLWLKAQEWMERLKNIGIKLMGILWEHVKREFKRGVDRAVAHVRRMPSRVASAMGRVRDRMVSAASRAWSIVKTKFSTGITGTVNLVRSLPAKAAIALAGIGSVLVGAGRQLIQGLISGIGAMFGAVKGKLGELTGKLTSWKGPPSTDKVLLTPAGKMLIDGLIAGIDSRREDLRKTLRSITDEIGGTEIKAPKIAAGDMSAASKGLSAAIDGSLNTEGLVVKQKVLNYYAAEGSSIDSEEDLFNAADRSRMVGF